MDKMTGSKAERKGLDEALAYLRPGDTFVVWKLDRAGRSLTHLMRQVLPSLSKNPTHKRFTIERYISHCFGSPHGGILMNENIQQEITLACVTLLQRNAADYETARNCAVLHEPKTKREAIEMLLKAGSEPGITFGNVSDALWIVYKRSKPASQTRRWVMQLLLDLVRREDITASDAIEVAGTLYSLSPQGSGEQQEAVQILLALAKRRDIPFGDAVEAAHTLYVRSPKGSKERQQAIEALLAQARWPDTTAGQAQEAALALCYASTYPSKERNQGIQALIEVIKRPDLSFEDAVELDYLKSIVAGTKTLEKQQQVAKRQMWETVAKRSDLTSEQRAQLAETHDYYRNN